MSSLWKKLDLPAKIGMGCGGLFLVCIIMTVLLAALADGVKDKARPTATAIPAEKVVATKEPPLVQTPVASLPTNTPAPSPTPLPTYTLQPTYTPVPTYTPPPKVSVPSGGDASVSLAYINWMQDTLPSVMEALTSISTLAGNPNMSSATWKATIRKHALTLRAAYLSAKTVTPPTLFVTSHTYFLSALEHFANAGTYLMDGIDKNDVASLQQAAMEMEIGNRLITSATEELNKIKVR